ncbi:MAG: hypothetical protein FJ295_13570 [Planctomycetes bacterium]|nr:hypothetical protein [Planctomycetota bacterium]
MGQLATVDSTKSSRNPIWGIALLLVAAASGCQVSVGGQTLPSPWYHKDDVQYYAPGPKFKLQKEASAQAEYAAEAKRQ